MERAFIVTSESKYHKELKIYEENYRNQIKAMNEFFELVGIETEKYYLRGDGRINKPFEEFRKNDIKLGIIPTDNDNVNFDKMLTRTDEHGSRDFRRNSKIGKELADYCIKNKVIINVREPEVRGYIESVGWRRYSRALLSMDDGNYALKVKSDSLREDDTPEGFIPIKLSEFYKLVEEKK